MLQTRRFVPIAMVSSNCNVGATTEQPNSVGELLVTVVHTIDRSHRLTGSISTNAQTSRSGSLAVRARHGIPALGFRGPTGVLQGSPGSSGYAAVGFR